jgi:hypothetical protein
MAAAPSPRKGGGKGIAGMCASRAAHARRWWLAEAESNAVNIVYSLTRLGK